MTHRSQPPANDRHADALAATFAALGEVPRTLAGLQQQVLSLTVAIRAMEVRLPSPLVSVHDAAKTLGCSTATIRRKVKAAEIPSLRLGRTVRVDLSKLPALDGGQIADLAARARRR